MRVTKRVLSIGNANLNIMLTQCIVLPQHVQMAWHSLSMCYKFAIIMTLAISLANTLAFVIAMAFAILSNHDEVHLRWHWEMHSHLQYQHHLQ